MKEFLQNKIVLVFLFFIVLCLSFYCIGKSYAFSTNLSAFSLHDIQEDERGIVLSWDKAHAASLYTVIIFNDTMSLEKEIEKEELIISDLSLKANEQVFIEVIAENSLGEERKSNNTLTYTNMHAALKEEKVYFTKEEDLSFSLSSWEEDLSYEIYAGDILVDASNISSLQIVLLKKIINKNEMRYEFLLKKKNRILYRTVFFVDAPLIGSFELTYSNTHRESLKEDIMIPYKGGENATDIIIDLIEPNGSITSIKQAYNGNSAWIDATNLKENTDYQVIVSAVYKDYIELAKTCSFSLSIKEQAITNPVYLDKNYTFIKANTKVRLQSRTPDATIYYTLDGSTPTTKSPIYKEALLINEDVVLKTFASSHNRIDSEINTYSIHVGTKPLVVYLSPSNQYGNYGVRSTGFTNEKKEMNDLTNYLGKILKEYGVKVYRNNPNAHLNDWNLESNYVKADLHLAIHSNGSIYHDTRGVEIYVDKPTSPSLSIATVLYENLYAIYPNKDETTDRGVKFAKGSLGEANDNFVHNGTLIEIAHHDDYLDALWIMNNKENIARNLAMSILEFYQVI